MAFRIGFVSVVVAVAAIACGSGLPPLASAADATRVQSRFAGSSVASLSEGRNSYVARCGNCHALIPPSAFSADKWAQEVREMQTSKGVHLNPEEELQIMAYLTAISSRSTPSGEKPQGG